MQITITGPWYVKQAFMHACMHSHNQEPQKPVFICSFNSIKWPHLFQLHSGQDFHELYCQVKLINNRWAWALVSQGWWSRAKLSEEGGNHGNPEAATTHQEAPSHWRTQWNTYRPHRWNQPTGGWDGRKMQLASVTASETDSCKH